MRICKVCDILKISKAWSSMKHSKHITEGHHIIKKVINITNQKQTFFYLKCIIYQHLTTIVKVISIMGLKICQIRKNTDDFLSWLTLAWRSYVESLSKIVDLHFQIVQFKSVSFHSPLVQKYYFSRKKKVII